MNELANQPTAWSLLGYGWLVMIVLMAALWWVQVRTRNAGIVDVCWAIGVGALGVAFAIASSGGDPLRRALIGACIGLWGLRLGMYLFKRVTSEAEDGRYQALREHWGERTQPYMFIFFQVQALWAVLFAIPVLAAARNPAPVDLLAWLGVAIWAVALIGERTADSQLARFRADPTNRGGVCDVGLWRYSRHPNYFFEWLHWWAYVAFGISGAWHGEPWGWVTLAGPAVMLWFLLKITGVPPTEERALASRGDAYRDYQRRTNRFFPGPPKTEPPNTGATR
jgi:steroid 5-alpha reductase family enzyme